MLLELFSNLTFSEVFFTLPLCGLSFILACVAIITQNWVTGRDERQTTGLTRQPKQQLSS